MTHATRRSVLLIAAAAFFAIAAPASAGYVTVENESQRRETAERIAFYGERSEKNSLLVSTDGEEVLVTDSASRLEAVTPCVAETAKRVRCPTVADGKRASGIEYFYAFLGGGRDSANFADYTTPGGAVVEGYAGNDVIRGTRRDDLLYGGSGKDRIVARGGADVIRGDGWFEEENEEPNHRNLRDVIKGGGGRDSVRYADEGHDATTIHLGGGKGEDKLRGVEHAEGTSGADKITGSNAANRLDGGEGGESGRDTIRGRGGDDLILADEARRISCGAGRDEIKVDAGARPERDCEFAYAGYLVPVRVSTAYEVADGQISFLVACPSEEEQIDDDNYGDEPCKDTLRLKRAGGGMAGSAKFEFQMGESGTVSIPLDEADRAALADGTSFSLEAKGGGFYNYGFTVPLAR